MATQTPVHVIDYAALVASASSDRERVELSAEWIGSVFDRFYDEFLSLTWMAKSAFEDRDAPASVAHAKRRLGLYNATVYALAERAACGLSVPGAARSTLGRAGGGVPARRRGLL